MSFTLTVNHSSHIFPDDPYARSNTLSSDATSNQTVYHHRPCRTFSGLSFASSSPASVHRAFASQENVHTLRSVRSTLSPETHKPKMSKDFSQFADRALWMDENTSPTGDSRRVNTLSSVLTTEDSNDENRVRRQSLFDGFDSSAELDAVETEIPSDSIQTGTDSTNPSTPFDAAPFRKWLATLRRRDEPQALTALPYRIPIDGIEDLPTRQDHYTARPRASTVESSTRGFITAVKSATVTLTDSSIATRSWLGGLSKQLHKGRHTRSNTVDSIGSSIDGTVDEVAIARAIQRRHILEELIETEESYAADLRVLQNIYTALLPATALPTPTRASIKENIMQLIELHEAMLGKLYEAIPYSEYNQKHARESPVFHPRSHIRWHSTDGSPAKDRLARLNNTKLGRRLRHSLDGPRPAQEYGMASVTGPGVVAAVVRIFESHMKLFRAYEEYAAKYENMAQHLASAYKDLASKEVVERGIEVLARTISSTSSRAEHGRKGLTFQDLLIKPIQRVCKYPLLFGDLLKQTPVGDDPVSHAELQSLVGQLRLLATDINKATHDLRTKDLIEKTWLLQDRLNFGNQPIDLVLIRHLGHVRACGVLHVAYQTKKEVKGQYMLCAVFRSCLLLATPDKSGPGYTVVACISLTSISIEEPDSGRGLQCHSTPFSFKLVFESDLKLYELLLSACSPGEEQAWKQHLRQVTDVSNRDDVLEIHRNLSSELIHEIKPLASVFGQNQPLLRRISINRAATLASKSQMCQVVIRNTMSTDHVPPGSSSSSQLGRSQSLMTPNHIPVLCPRRSERIQLESAMSDIYTKDALPFPGMRGSENPFRASAHSVMRKLSMASITSSFSRRSASLASLHGPRPKQQPSEDAAGRPLRNRLVSNSRSTEAAKAQASAHAVAAPPPVVLTKPAVNFHKTPEAFLPVEFSLPESRAPTLQRSSVIRAVASKQVLAGNPSFPEYKKVKRAMSMQGNFLFDENRVPLPERPNLQTAKSEMPRRKSVDAGRVFEEIPVHRQELRDRAIGNGKENAPPMRTRASTLQRKHSLHGTKQPLSERLKEWWG